MIQNSWRYFFDEYAEKYDNEIFTKNTKAEIDFIEQELNIPAGSFILDVGCGTGRHSIELAKRGYSVKGIDISERMLSIARKNVKKKVSL
ncbi:class I SAM-dependent methyltransferase [Pseudothermotoga sp.]|uniref:class I SAM-dependent methyltransferase n=1 Tax=Pseudothermotoga sp. TaxID=2033661 RepID=UPI00258DF638|nr:class I SAM-dependent methyltransferase [Pseudothermotoga sp.]MDK2884294.1 hypothetical protein [Pseudothermotoga sp.]